MDRPHSPGSIVTFYSYKGGTGRTMALANTACVLAERLKPDEKLLVVDWDLEAPGLHQYLPPRLRPRAASLDTGLGAQPGLIDLFVALRQALPEAEPESELQAQEATAQALERVAVEPFIGDTELDDVHILRAGRNDDGHYSRRVNTFDWEGLFRRAPGIYRALAERLRARYRHVLIDSRTGISDISGICTTLLPEKLVVVFTPNRQSFTGVRELVQRATSYRLGSDDLRPLLVYPLPSRIEVSMERLNRSWRHGDIDAGIAGYQPMFESLLKECYALPNCDLTHYFDEVQIQQSADCAYGEVISVRASASERLSLASSYRVFADRLLSPQPPWESPMVPSAAAPAAAEPLAFDPAGEPITGVFHVPRPPPQRAGGSAIDPGGRAGAATVTASPRPQIYLSHAREDRAAATDIADALMRAGYDIAVDRDLLPGVDFQQAVASELDASDVIIVCWSRASVASEFVRLEAGEGSRRGILLPVLLDDTFPPLEFRSFQAVDLSRRNPSGLQRLCEAVDRMVQRKPPPVAPASAERLDVTITSLAAPAGKTPDRSTPQRTRWAAAAAAIVLLIGAGAWFVVDRDPMNAPVQVATLPPPPALGGGGDGALPIPPPVGQGAPAPRPIEPPAAVPVPGSSLSVPNFQGQQTADAAKIAAAVGVTVQFVDTAGRPLSAHGQGVVTAQSPAAGNRIDAHRPVRLTLSTDTTEVPSIIGIPLGSALDILDRNGLALGRSEPVYAPKVQAGHVLNQSPQPGARVAAGTRIDVGVASAAATNRGRPRTY